MEYQPNQFRGKEVDPDHFHALLDAKMLKFELFRRERPECETQRMKINKRLLLREKTSIYIFSSAVRVTVESATAACVFLMSRLSGFVFVVVDLLY